ncbi:MAG: hypothetical protein JNM63_02025, partial [Spirochaetia bacterium]|nr:hypothetical protein [Spirochaetia bacterium]
MARLYFFSVQLSLIALLTLYTSSIGKYGAAAHLAVYGLLVLVAAIQKKGSLVPLWILAVLGMLIGGADILFYLYKAKSVTVFIFLHLILIGGSLFLLSYRTANETESDKLVDRFNLWVPPTTLITTCSVYLLLDFGTPAWDQA